MNISQFEKEKKNLCRDKILKCVNVLDMVYHNFITQICTNKCNIGRFQPERYYITGQKSNDYLCQTIKIKSNKQMSDTKYPIKTPSETLMLNGLV